MSSRRKVHPPSRLIFSYSPITSANLSNNSQGANITLFQTSMIANERSSLCPISTASIGQSISISQANIDLQNLLNGAVTNINNNNNNTTNCLGNGLDLVSLNKIISQNPILATFFSNIQDNNCSQHVNIIPTVTSNIIQLIKMICNSTSINSNEVGAFLDGLITEICNIKNELIQKVITDNLGLILIIVQPDEDDTPLNLTQPKSEVCVSYANENVSFFSLFFYS